MMKELQSKKKKIVVEGLKKAYKAKDGKFSLEAIEKDMLVLMHRIALCGGVAAKTCSPLLAGKTNWVPEG